MHDLVFDLIELAGEVLDLIIERLGSAEPPTGQNNEQVLDDVQVPDMAPPASSGPSREEG